METVLGTKPPPAGVLDRVTKALPLTGMIFSGLIAVLFLADLAAKFPFQRVSPAADVGFAVSGLILAYMSWSIMDRGRARPRPPSEPSP
jgi:hypothetical protein